MFNIDEELKKLPHLPGVYLMHDAYDNIIYVGKAISLRNRVRQYFRESTSKSPKIEKMVSKIARFEYIITDSELEALILECNLIKEYRPRYNTMLKDDKTYPYIKVTVGEEYPRILLSRKMKKDKNKYFGPYTSGKAVRDTIELLQKLFKIRTCNRTLPRDIGKDRPCLNYHIKQCSCPCGGHISKEEYNESINQVLDFLNGNFKDVLAMLEERMKAAAELMEFEDAAYYRDLIASVKHVANRQKITSNEQEDRDIIAYSGEDFDAVVQMFFIRGGKLIGREHYHLSIAPYDTGRQILTSFIKQYYAGSPFVPREIFMQLPIDEQDIIEKWLSEKRGAKVTIKVPLKGEKNKLVKLAEKNAKLILQQDKEKLKIEEIKTTGAVKEISELIGVPDI